MGYFIEGVDKANPLGYIRCTVTRNPERTATMKAYTAAIRAADRALRAYKRNPTDATYAAYWAASTTAIQARAAYRATR